MGHEYVGVVEQAARQLGAERIIAMSRHRPRQKLAIECGEAGVAKQLTGGLGAHSVIEVPAPRSR